MPKKHCAELLLNAIENDNIDWESVARECIARMSHDDIEDMIYECDWDSFIEMEDDDVENEYDEEYED